MKRLSARERQIMDIIIRLGESTATTVEAEMSDPPSNATIRTTLRALEEKGQVQYRKQGRQFVYFPTAEPEQAQTGALEHLVQTFFGGSAPNAMAALLSRKDFDAEELDALSQMIEQSRKKDG